MEPLLNVKLVNTKSSGLAPKVKLVAIVFRPLDLVKNGTIVAIAPVLPTKAIFLSTPSTATFELTGRTAPCDDIVIVPVPSEEINDPPRLMVLLARNKVPHLRFAVPRLYTLSASGTIADETARRFAPPPPPMLAVLNAAVAARNAVFALSKAGVTKT